jgi:hypothetical protein
VSGTEHRPDVVRELAAFTLSFTAGVTVSLGVFFLGRWLKTRADFDRWVLTRVFAPLGLIQVAAVLLTGALNLVSLSLGFLFGLVVAFLQNEREGW